MATEVQTEPSERLLNRELSLLDFHARVLELAADESVPLLERVKFACDLRLEPRRVLPGARRRPARPGGVGPPDALGRRADAAAGPRPDPRARARAHRAAVEDLEERAPPRPRRRGHRRRRHRGRGREGARGARDAVPARDLPGADAARRRPGTAVPVHLRPLAVARASSCPTPRRARSASRA